MLYTIPEISQITSIPETTLRERRITRNIDCIKHNGNVFLNHANAERLSEQTIPQHVSDRLVYEFTINNPQLSHSEIISILCLPEDYVLNFSEAIFESKINFM